MNEYRRDVTGLEIEASNIGMYNSRVSRKAKSSGGRIYRQIAFELETEFPRIQRT